MQRVGSVLRKLKLAAGLSPEDLVRTAWPHAVGPQIARHTRVAGLRGRLLIIEVEEELWAQNLDLFERDILRNLAEIAGPGVVTCVAVRAVPPRIAPGRAEPVRSADEADRIDDPVLRRIYRDSRRQSAS